MTFRPLPIASSLLLACASFSLVSADWSPYVIGTTDILEIGVVKLSNEREIVSGGHLVRPGGVVSLGVYGEVTLAKLTFAEAETVIAKKFADHFGPGEEFKVSVRLGVPLSKQFEIIMYDELGDRPEDERHKHHTLVATSETTVASAILQIEGLAAVASVGQVYVNRSSGEEVSVDWKAITQEGKLATNVRVNPGDLIVVMLAKPGSRVRRIYKSEN